MREDATRESIVRRSGKSPIVVFAPHGGRRKRPLKRGDGINDLYTAEIATVIAERLDAYAIVNAGIDRNDVDLNRISELVSRAPGVLTMLRDTVEQARGETGAVPLVLLIHGWNVSSLHCDIGIGLRDRNGELVGAQPTVAPETLESFVVPLRRELEQRGLTGLLGHRYPASGADNTTQLFSGRHGTHTHPEVIALSRMAIDGHVDAVQLELSIVLRWPGEHRDRFVDALTAASLAHMDARSRSTARVRVIEGAAREKTVHRNWARLASRAADEAAGATSTMDEASFAGESVQAVLANGGGLFMAVEPTDKHSLAARVCAALPDGRLALFVCEAPRRAADRGLVEAGGLRWSIGGRARFSGPAVLYPTHEAFLDLEHGLEGALLANLEVDVGSNDGESPFEPSGYVRIGDEVIAVAGGLVRRSGGRLGGGAPPVARIYLTDDGIAGEPLLIEQRGVVQAGIAAVECKDREIVVRHASFGELRGRVSVRIPVYRPAGDGRYLAILFGIAELGSAREPRRALFETVDYLEISP